MPQVPMDFGLRPAAASAVQQAAAAGVSAASLPATDTAGEEVAASPMAGAGGTGRASADLTSLPSVSEAVEEDEGEEGAGPYGLPSLDLEAEAAQQEEKQAASGTSPPSQQPTLRLEDLPPLSASEQLF